MKKKIKRTGVIFLWHMIILCTGSLLYAKTDFHDALFARVTGITQDDVLNVRSKPDYHAVKTGALPIDAFVGIERCIRSGRSVWCKVSHLAQRDYETFGYDAKPGWVNARYLTLFDRGYVLIDNEANCDYVLSCDNGQCDVVSRVVTRGDKVVGIETAKIARSKLTPANHFSAAASEMEGYCTAGRYIEGYLGEKRVQRLESRYDDPAYRKAFGFVSRFNLEAPKSAQTYLHENLGLRIAYLDHFDKHSHLFTPHEIGTVPYVRQEKLFWGTSEGKGERIEKSLDEVLSDIVFPVEETGKVVRLHSLRNFPCPKDALCKGYAFLQTGKTAQETKGVIVILQYYRREWYVVGLLKEKWSI